MRNSTSGLREIGKRLPTMAVLTALMLSACGDKRDEETITDEVADAAADAMADGGDTVYVDGYDPNVAPGNNPDGEVREAMGGFVVADREHGAYILA